jgi:formylglycine-generating enzyme required for sulfatase activity
MKKLMLLNSVVLALSTFATPAISNLKVTPIEPLGIAIDFTVSGATDMSLDKERQLAVSMTLNGKDYFAQTLVGSTNCLNGAHRVYWNMAKDGLSVDLSDASLTVMYRYPLYCVINLSDGSTANGYTVTYMKAPPKDGFNTTEYKTTKLVLKRVDPGIFTMGDSDARDFTSLENNNWPHTVALTKSFYMGLYEVTQKQWELVMGSGLRSSTGDGAGEEYPAYYVSYDMIRGASDGSKWPATNTVDSSSFLGKLRDRTKMNFDLPTEAQWEYTCRAGSTTKYSYGDSADGDYMWYKGNASKSQTVGAKKPNAWGFYDMHGNVFEACLDWYVILEDDEADPHGPSSSSEGRVYRGGCWNIDATYCASSFRENASDTSASSHLMGFRLAMPIQ